ncbi:MAG TPA: mercuric reductase [Dehalococcoidia bacterium]|nr:mercuric reductase [Dehalococcoidia bacterium]
MAEELQYDAIVIGSGQGGGPFAGALAGAGRKTALIERSYVGGTCVNYGCTPTKTMVASAQAAYIARRGADYGVMTGPIRIDMEKVRERKRAIVELWRSSSLEATLNTKGLDYIHGDAQFTGPHAVEVTLDSGEQRSLIAGLIVIDTGLRPAMPPIEGLAALEPLDSTSIMELDSVPQRLLVLGGGYVGVEFGQMFRRFGSEVTIVDVASRLLGREDRDIADAMVEILREDGIEILLDTKTLRAQHGARGGLELTVQTQSAERTLSGSHILAAAGRAPNTSGLHLEAAGVCVNEKGFIAVNDRLETNVPGIYAIGDVNGEAAFTHISYDDYRILKANLLEGGSRSTSDRPVPYTVFTDPQLGRVGLSEDQARAEGRSIRVASMPMRHVARALEVDQSRGMMKVVIDAETDQILGCAILGIDGGEVMSMIEIAMMGNLPASRLRDGVFSHPTLAEALNNLLS